MGVFADTTPQSPHTRTDARCVCNRRLFYRREDPGYMAASGSLPDQSWPQ